MPDSAALEQLSLSPASPKGFVPRPSASLLERIRDYGAIEPVVVRPLDDNRYEILANPEVWVAAGRVGLPSVPVVIRDDIDDDQAADIVSQHYGARQRNPIDEAEHFAEQLEAFGGRRKRGAITKLAAATGRSRSYIAHSLRLLTLPAKVQSMIATGRLSAGQARPLVSLDDRLAQLRLARRIVDEKLSARDAESMARSLKSETPSEAATPAAAPAKDADTMRLERQLSELVGCPVSLDHAKGEMTIRYFGDFDTLEGVLARIGYRFD